MHLRRFASFTLLVPLLLTQPMKKAPAIKLPFKPTAIAFAPPPSKLVCITTREAAFVTTLR